VRTAPQRRKKKRKKKKNSPQTKQNSLKQNNSQQKPPARQKTRKHTNKRIFILLARIKSLLYISHHLIFHPLISTQSTRLNHKTQNHKEFTYLRIKMKSC
jgi:hypothetical protein